MTRPDDSTLDPNDLRAVEARASRLLDRASAWGVFPTPVDDIVAAAKLKVAPKNAFDPATFLAYVAKKTSAAVNTLKSALSKVLGLYDANEEVIHIDHSMGKPRQTFLTLHETGHHEIPTHKKIFRLFQDCEKTLAPDIADQFEREANNFARYALFQGDAFKTRAADMPMSVKTPLGLSSKFGASVYASAREFARTHHRACVVYVLEPVEVIPGGGFRATVRRIETSAEFQRRFGAPTDTVIDQAHALADVIPIGRKMTGPRTVIYSDRNGVRHECVADAFNSTHNVIILVHAVESLTSTSIVFPGFPIT